MDKLRKFLDKCLAACKARPHYNGKQHYWTAAFGGVMMFTDHYAENTTEFLAAWDMWNNEYEPQFLEDIEKGVNNNA